MQVGADDGVGLGRGAGDEAVALLRLDPRREAGEGLGHGVAGLALQPVEVEAAPVEPRRRAGLQPAEGEAARLQRGREAVARGLADAPGGDADLADVDQPAQEGAGGEHGGAAGEAAAVRQGDGRDAVAGDVEAESLALDEREVRLRRQGPLHGGAVEGAVRLGAGAAHGRALAAVQDAELDAAGVGHPGHDAVEGVDLADEVALAEAADGGVAGQGADRGEALGDERRAGAGAGRRRRGFAAGVAAADHDDVEGLGHG